MKETHAQREAFFFQTVASSIRLDLCLLLYPGEQGFYCPEYWMESATQEHEEE